MRNFLLIVHIVAVAAWLGGNLTQLMLLPMFEKAGHAPAIVWHKATGKMAQVYYSVAGGVVLITGVFLVLDNDFWEFSQTFVSIGFLVVIFGAIMGMAFFGPTSRKAVEAHEQGDEAAAKEISQRILLAGALDTVLIIVAIYAMVKKLGV